MLEKISELCLGRDWGGINLDHGVNQLIRCKRFIEDIEDTCHGPETEGMSVKLLKLGPVWVSNKFKEVCTC